MALTELLSFALASFVLALTPGPDVLLVLATAAARGWRKGMALALGLASGVIVHTALVAFGVAAVLARIPAALLAIKLFGAIYLLWLAWQSWYHRNAHLGPSENSITSAGSEEPAARWYWRGIIMNLSNPKVLLFFLAFLSEFADPARSGFVWRVMVLGVIFMLMTIVVFGTVAVLAARGAGRFMESPQFQTCMNVVASMIFVVIAAWLMLTA